MFDMSFLTANFGWILLAVVLFAMLIVGYVADKTDFGHKKTSKKKEIENPNKVEELDLDNLKGKTLSDMVGGSNDGEQVADINADLNAPFGDVVAENTNEEVNNNLDELYAPIGDDLNAPFGDTSKVDESVTDDILSAPIETPVENETKTEEVNNDVFNNDIFAPISDVEPSNEVTEESIMIPEEPKEEVTESLDEIIPEVKVDTIPENDDILAPIEDTSDIVLDNPVENIETPVENSADIVLDNPVEDVVTENVDIPVENIESPVETIPEFNIPAETDEVVIPAEPAVETVDIPMDIPVVEDIIPETTETVNIETPTEEILVEEEKPKKKKKEKKKKEEDNKYSVDYEQEIVPEVITEKFNDGTTPVSSDDDIWKF